MVGKAIFEANIEIRAGLRESLSKKQQCWSRIRSSMVEELTSNKFTATASLEIFLKSRLLQNPESCRTFERVATISKPNEIHFFPQWVQK